MPVIPQIFKGSISGFYFPVKVQPFCPTTYPLTDYRLVYAVIVIRREMVAQVRSSILDLAMVNMRRFLSRSYVVNVSSEWGYFLRRNMSNAVCAAPNKPEQSRTLFG